MKVKDCKGCKHCKRKVWSNYHMPRNYHAIGMSHAYAYCEKHRCRCLQIKKCTEYKCSQ